MSRPNLFNYATSELSQDAFICWLLSWADPVHREEDRLLHTAGTDFLKALFAQAGHQCPEPIQKLEVLKQYQNIDVLVLVNDVFPLLIEDKTNTKNHSGQLIHYQNAVKKEFSLASVPAIYFKTGDQSCYTGVEQDGYAVFGRKHLLTLLRKSLESGVKDQIFLDFYHYLLAIEESVCAFSTLPVSEWTGNCWKGFFIELQEQLQEGTWDYVPNPSGGFFGFWWHGKGNKYLQLEQDKLCFKIEVPEKHEQSPQRREWYRKLVSASGKGHRNVQKPARFGQGRWMTAAVVSGDYRKCDEQGVLDLAATVQGLREVETFMDEVLSGE